MSKTAKLLTLGIDCGKYNIKSLSDGLGSNVLRNTLKKVDKFNDTSNENVLKITYQGENYLLGESVVAESFVDSKSQESNKIAALAIIAKHHVENDGIVVGYGCPASAYYGSSIERQRIVDMLTGQHSITIDGKKYDFKVIDTTVLPEGLGAINNNLNKDVDMVLVDIGGLNVNAMIFKGNKLQQETIITDKLGTNVLTDRCLSALNANIPTATFKYEIVQTWVETSNYPNPIVEEIIEKEKKQLIDDIVKLLKKKQIDLDFLPSLWIGGGSILLKSKINGLGLKASVAVNGAFDNCLAFAKMAKMKAQKLSS